ncbi:glycosyl transferase, partial [filamentous cyanobacterium CCT1]
VLTPEEFFEGEWDFLRQPLHPPRRTAAIAKHGNEQIATAIVNYLANVL